MYTADMKVEDVVKGKTLEDVEYRNRRERNTIHKDTLDKMFNDLYVLQGHLAEKEHMIEQLVDKLYVEFEGDAMKGSFTLRFNQFPPPQDDVQKAIIKQVIVNYGLELGREKEAVENFISLLNAISTKEDYCEVDLFSKDKKPVEC